MGEAQTFYGEWIEHPDREEPYPLIPYALWETLRWGDMGLSVDVSDSDGLLEDDVDIKKMRRVYPPGSVLPEPRRLLDVHPDAFRVCGLWMVRRYGHEKHSWRCMRGWLAAAGRGVDVAAAEGYPVQLLNGAPVPVPWSAVEVRNG